MVTDEQRATVEWAKDTILTVFTQTPAGGIWRVVRVAEHPETDGTWMITLAHGGPYGRYPQVLLTLDPMPTGGQPYSEPPF